MIRTVLFPAMCFLFHACREGDDCDALKKGQFYYLPNARKYLLVRDSNMQMEIDLATRDTSYFMMNWTAPCTYTLQLQRGSELKNDSLGKPIQYPPITVGVVAVERDFYTFKATFPGEPEPSAVDTIWRKDPR